jgi:aryl-alcohol dehydrogenase-like predicted oxidoreductase
LPFNMLQQEIQLNIVPWCQSRDIAVTVYWALMKGLLSGRLPRDTPLDEKDNRLKYPMYQDEEWQKNQDFVDRLREIAAMSGHTVAQLVVNWTIHQSDITAALCGAKRPDQIRETAGALGWTMTSEQRKLVDEAIAQRGPPEKNRVFV